MSAIFSDLSLAYSSMDYPLLILLMSIILFVAGATVVSFTRYIVYLIGSLSEDETLICSIFSPPSHVKLNVLHLVPFYGPMVRGGDGSSHTSFGIYAIMQLAMGVLTASIPLLVGDFDWWVSSFTILLWCGFLIAWIDYEHHIIPEELTWFLLFAGLLMSPGVVEVYDRICGAALGAFSMWMAMFVVSLLKRENTYAGGDVSFAAVAGAWVGVFFVPWYLLILSVIYICHTAPLRLKGVKWVPMGPALVIALLVSMLILHGNYGRPL